MGRFANWIAGLRSRKALNDGGVFAAMVQQSTAPARGTAELIAAYRVSPWFRAVVSKISFNVASTQWRLFVPQGGRRSASITNTKFGAPGTRKQAILKALNADDLMEVDMHPALQLLSGMANPMMTGLSARKLTQSYLDIKGEAFWILSRDGLGRAVQYTPIPPNWVVEVPSDENGSYMVQYGSTRSSVPAGDMIWFRDLDPANPFGRGSGTGEALGDELETDEYLAKMIKTTFLNRGKPDLMIGVEGATQAQLMQARSEFDHNHRGFWKAGRSFWHPGKLDVKELNQKFVDLEVNQSREWQRNIMIQVYGVPPEILGVIENSNRATIEGAREIFAAEVLVPRLEFLRTELQTKLIAQFDERLILDYDSPIPNDREFMLKAMVAAPWAATRAEWRAAMGLDDRGTGDDVHLMPFNLVPVPAPSEAAPEELASAPNVSKLIAPKMKALKEDEISDLLNNVRVERLTRETQSLWSDELKAWIARQSAAIGVEPSFEVINPVYVRHLAEFATDRMKDINKTTRDAIKETLLQGVRAGEGAVDLGKRIQEVFDDADKRRALMIARTETGRSANFGTNAAIETSGVAAGKEWIATPDDRTRDTHSDLDGAIVPIGEKFLSSSGAQTDFPGNFGVQDEDINCRCTTAAVIDPDELPKMAKNARAIRRATSYKVFDRDSRSWEQKALIAFRTAFKEQEKDILGALARAEGVSAA